MSTNPLPFLLMRSMVQSRNNTQSPSTMPHKTVSGETVVPTAYPSRPSPLLRKRPRPHSRMHPVQAGRAAVGRMQAVTGGVDRTHAVPREETRQSGGLNRCSSVCYCGTEKRRGGMRPTVCGASCEYGKGRQLVRAGPNVIPQGGGGLASHTDDDLLRSVSVVQGLLERPHMACAAATAFSATNIVPGSERVASGSYEDIVMRESVANLVNGKEQENGQISPGIGVIAVPSHVRRPDPNDGNNAIDSSTTRNGFVTNGLQRHTEGVSSTVQRKSSPAQGCLMPSPRQVTVQRPFRSTGSGPDATRNKGSLRRRGTAKPLSRKKDANTRKDSVKLPTSASGSLHFARPANESNLSSRQRLAPHSGAKIAGNMPNVAPVLTTRPQVVVGTPPVRIPSRSGGQTLVTASTAVLAESRVVVRGAAPERTNLSQQSPQEQKRTTLKPRRVPAAGRKQSGKRVSKTRNRPPAGSRKPNTQTTQAPTRTEAPTEKAPPESECMRGPLLPRYPPSASEQPTQKNVVNAATQLPTQAAPSACIAKGVPSHLHMKKAIPSLAPSVIQDTRLSPPAPELRQSAAGQHHMRRAPPRQKPLCQLRKAQILQPVQKQSPLPNYSISSSPSGMFSPVSYGNTPPANLCTTRTMSGAPIVNAMAHAPYPKVPPQQVTYSVHAYQPPHPDLINWFQVNLKRGGQPTTSPHLALPVVSYVYPSYPYHPQNESYLQPAASTHVAGIRHIDTVQAPTASEKQSLSGQSVRKQFDVEDTARTRKPVGNARPSPRTDEENRKTLPSTAGSRKPVETVTRNEETQESTRNQQTSQLAVGRRRRSRNSSGRRKVGQNEDGNRSTVQKPVAKESLARPQAPSQPKAAEKQQHSKESSRPAQQLVPESSMNMAKRTQVEETVVTEAEGKDPQAKALKQREKRKRNVSALQARARVTPRTVQKVKTNLGAQSPSKTSSQRARASPRRDSNSDLRKEALNASNGRDASKMPNGTSHSVSQNQLESQIVESATETQKHEASSGKHRSAVNTRVDKPKKNFGSTVPASQSTINLPANSTRKLPGIVKPTSIVRQKSGNRPADRKATLKTVGSNSSTPLKISTPGHLPNEPLKPTCPAPRPEHHQHNVQTPLSVSKDQTASHLGSHNDPSTSEHATASGENANNENSNTDDEVVEEIVEESLYPPPPTPVQNKPTSSGPLGKKTIATPPQGLEETIEFNVRKRTEKRGTSFGVNKIKTRFGTSESEQQHGNWFNVDSRKQPKTSSLNVAGRTVVGRAEVLQKLSTVLGGKGSLLVSKDPARPRGSPKKPSVNRSTGSENVASPSAREKLPPMRNSSKTSVGRKRVSPHDSLEKESPASRNCVEKEVDKPIPLRLRLRLRDKTAGHRSVSSKTTRASTSAPGSGARTRASVNERERPPKCQKSGKKCSSDGDSQPEHLLQHSNDTVTGASTGKKRFRTAHESEESFTTDPDSRRKSSADTNEDQDDDLKERGVSQTAAKQRGGNTSGVGHSRIDPSPRKGGRHGRHNQSSIRNQQNGVVALDLTEEEVRNGWAHAISDETVSKLDDNVEKILMQCSSLKCGLCLSPVEVRKCFRHPCLPIRSFFICEVCHSNISESLSRGKGSDGVQFVPKQVGEKSNGNVDVFVFVVEEMVQGLAPSERKHGRVEDAYVDLCNRDVEEAVCRMKSLSVPYEMITIIRILLDELGVKFQHGKFMWPQHVVTLRAGDDTKSLITGAFPRSLSDVKERSTLGERVWTKVFGDLDPLCGPVPSCRIFEKVLGLWDVKLEHTEACEGNSLRGAPSCKVRLNMGSVGALMKRAHISLMCTSVKKLFEFEGRTDIERRALRTDSSRAPVCCVCGYRRNQEEFPFHFVKCGACARRFCSMCLTNVLGSCELMRGLHGNEEYKCLVCRFKDNSRERLDGQTSTNKLSSSARLNRGKNGDRRNRVRRGAAASRERGQRMPLLILSSAIRKRMYMAPKRQRAFADIRFAKLCEVLNMQNIFQQGAFAGRDSNQPMRKICFRCKFSTRREDEHNHSNTLERSAKRRKISCTTEEQQQQQQQQGHVVRCGDKSCSNFLHVGCFQGSRTSSKRQQQSGPLCPQHKCAKCNNRNEAELVRCRTCPTAFCKNHLPDIRDIHIFSDRLIACETCRHSLQVPQVSTHRLLQQKDGAVTPHAGLLGIALALGKRQRLSKVEHL